MSEAERFENESPTINGLVAVVTEINTANGWRERDMRPLTYENPKAQIAGMTKISDQVARIIEAIRKNDSPDKAYNDIHAWGVGVEDMADQILDQLKEHGKPLYGSKTEAICRVRLIDTETAELSDAIKVGDTLNMAEELADIVIRVLDFVGAWNDAHQGLRIDLEAEILAKLEKNRTRGYRHGGKRA